MRLPRKPHARAVTRAAAGSPMNLTVRNTGRLCGLSTTGTCGLLTATRSMAGLGNESATAMLRRIFCVSCA